MMSRPMKNLEGIIKNKEYKAMLYNIQKVSKQQLCPSYSIGYEP